MRKMFSKNQIESMISQLVESYNFQPKLVSGFNIKKVNNKSILGSGNVNLTKLYKHTITMTDVDDVYSFVIINWSDTPITKDTLKSQVNVGLDCISISKEVNQDSWTFAPCYVEYDEDNLIFYAVLSDNDNLNGHISFITPPTFVDTIIEL